MTSITDHARENAEARLKNIVAMVTRLEHARECSGSLMDCDLVDLIECPDCFGTGTIEENVTNSKQEECDRCDGEGQIAKEEPIFDGEFTFDDYHSESDAEQRIQEDPLSVQVRSGWVNPVEDMTAEEFEILLTTGGPALRIIGDLGQWHEPSSARLEYQDWGTPWEEYIVTGSDHTALIEYASRFWFGA